MSAHRGLVVAGFPLPMRRREDRNRTRFWRRWPAHDGQFNRLAKHMETCISASKHRPLQRGLSAHPILAVCLCCARAVAAVRGRAVCSGSCPRGGDVHAPPPNGSEPVLAARCSPHTLKPYSQSDSPARRGLMYSRASLRAVVPHQCDDAHLGPRASAPLRPCCRRTCLRVTVGLYQLQGRRRTMARRATRVQR